MLVQGYEKTNNNVIINYGIAIAIILLQPLTYYISVAKDINNKKA